MGTTRRNPAWLLPLMALTLLVTDPPSAWAQRVCILGVVPPCRDDAPGPSSGDPEQPDPPPPHLPPPSLPPPPTPPVESKEETLGLHFTFENGAECREKLSKVVVARVEFPGNETAAMYCDRLFPQGLKVSALNVMLPAHFSFLGQSDCESKTTTDLNDAGATTVFPVGETAATYCADLFPADSATSPADLPPPPPPQHPGENPTPPNPPPHSDELKCPPGMHPGQAGPTSVLMCVPDNEPIA